MPTRREALAEALDVIRAAGEVRLVPADVRRTIQRRRAPKPTDMLILWDDGTVCELVRGAAGPQWVPMGVATAGGSAA